MRAVRPISTRALVGIQVIALTGAVVGAIFASRQADWVHLDLFFGLLAVALISDSLALRMGRLYVSGSFSALVLAMTLLGPTPAAVIGVTLIVVNALRSPLKPRLLLANLFAYTTFPLAGGLVARTLDPLFVGGDLIAALVLIVFIVSLLLNFVLIYGEHVLVERVTWRAGIRDVLIPVLPSELASGLLTCAVAILESKAGNSALLMSAIVVLVFQYLLRTARVAVDRGQELEERNQQLAVLQVGLISTMLKTLSLRDRMTARHSAAVARYSRAMAEALGLNEEEQELIHTAALFHDVGKFIFPDSILFADRRLTDEEFDIVRKHPVVGAELVGEIEGYGPIAELVRHHHERIDGRGYPDGLTGDDIPLGSRIMAVADTYDVMTARDTYRDPVSPLEAFAELRRVSGAQLDAQIVELFIELVTADGLAFRHSTEADFEAELALERRAFDYARPRKAA